jgi:hypothetical protein
LSRSSTTPSQISDRLDLTSRDIKRFYDGEQGDYLLKETLDRYGWFVNSFSGFAKYIDHCLLQDFCDENYDVKLWKDKYGLPESKEELVDFWEWSIFMLDAD